MTKIEYNYRQGKERLVLYSTNGFYFTTQREIYCPRKENNKWLFQETLFEVNRKTKIIKYLLEKDCNIDLDAFINL